MGHKSIWSWIWYPRHHKKKNFVEVQWQLRYICCTTQSKRRHLRSPLSFCMVLCMVSKKPYNHTCLTYGLQETFMLVIPDYAAISTFSVFKASFVQTSVQSNLAMYRTFVRSFLLPDRGILNARLPLYVFVWTY